MQTAEQRARYLLSQTPFKALTGAGRADHNRWANIKRGKARLGVEEFETLAKLYPQFAVWLITGSSDPEVPQAMPEIEDFPVTGEDGGEHF